MLPLLALTLGPWLGLSPTRQSLGSLSFDPAGSLVGEFFGFQEAAATRRAPGCKCRTVYVNANNLVRDAKVKTGDAKVENINVTYVSAGFADTEVDIDQEAEAISGDAIAGQILDVKAPGPGCVNIVVRARNDVKDVEVRSGDARAVNKSIVLLDPGVRRGDLEIDIEQEAVARSGRAVAGQIIGINAGGDRCSKVDLDAANNVSDALVATGKASFLNQAEVKTCAAVGCKAELRRLLGTADEVEVCSGEDCREVDIDDLGKELVEEPAPAEGPGERPAADGGANGNPCSPMRRPHMVPWGQGNATPSPTPPDDPEPQPSPESDASEPSPSPAAPPGCPESSPDPTPEPSPALMAAPTEGETAPDG